jgi:hypothetical protein
MLAKMKFVLEKKEICRVAVCGCVSEHNGPESWPGRQKRSNFMPYAFDFPSSLKFEQLCHRCVRTETLIPHQPHHLLYEYSQCLEEYAIHNKDGKLHLIY